MSKNILYLLHTILPNFASKCFQNHFVKLDSCNMYDTYYNKISRLKCQRGRDLRFFDETTWKWKGKTSKIIENCVTLYSPFFNQKPYFLSLTFINRDNFFVFRLEPDFCSDEVSSESSSLWRSRLQNHPTPFAAPKGGPKDGELCKFIEILVSFN